MVNRMNNGIMERDHVREQGKRELISTHLYHREVCL